MGAKLNLTSPLTVSVGRITVEYDGPAPTEKQLKEVEDLSNKIVRDNLEIKNFKIDRKEAEETYRSKLCPIFKQC